MTTRPYTLEEVRLIHQYYIENSKNKNGWLDELAKKINRPKENISRFARLKGLTDRKRGADLITRICENCGKEFKIHRYNTNHLCGKKCSIETVSKKRTGGHIWNDREHPKGMLGKTHTPEYRKEISDRMKEAWADKDSVFNSEENKQRRSDAMSLRMVGRIKTSAENYSRTIKGWREIGEKKYYFRSKWEMNIAYYLEWLKIKKEIKEWEYEVDTFWFEKIKRGVRSYTPDFKILDNKGEIYFIEVKGWMDAKSKTKLQRMKKYYPNIKIELYDETHYRTLKKQIGKICNWE